MAKATLHEPTGEVLLVLSKEETKVLLSLVGQVGGGTAPQLLSSGIFYAVSGLVEREYFFINQDIEITEETRTY